MRVSITDSSDSFDADDSSAMVHQVEPITDPYEEFETAFMKLISGPMYVPVSEALAPAEARCG